jgi:hypothetical protein
MVSRSARSGCASPKLHPVEKLNRRLDILTVKSRLDRPNRASWKAMKTQADGILARHSLLICVLCASALSGAQAPAQRGNWPGHGELFVGSCYQPVDAA